MTTVTKTKTFEKWYNKLKSKTVKGIIDGRIRSIEKEGHFGDYKSIGESVYELRIHYGAGYRIYYTWKGNQLIILLAGGNKASQNKDIDKAKKLKKELENDTKKHKAEPTEPKK